MAVCHAVGTTNNGNTRTTNRLQYKIEYLTKFVNAQKVKSFNFIRLSIKNSVFYYFINNYEAILFFIRTQ